MTERSAGPEPATGSESAGREPLRRYRALQVASVGLIATGLAISFAILLNYPGILAGEGDLPIDPDQAAGILVWLVLAGIGLIVGLVMHAVRSIVVREEMPASRYRGPSIVVLLMLAIVAANVASVSVAADVSALFGGEALTTLGSLLILTVTQLGMLGAVGLFVFAPRALAGLRLLPDRGLLRSVALGLVLSVPAWIGAQLIGYLTLLGLRAFDLQPETGIAEAALMRADPLVLLAALVIVAPIAEEVFFRGVAYNAWLREYGPRRAVFGSAVLFGFIHGSIFLFPAIVALGVVLAIVYRETRSLPAVIALHAAYNGITVALGLLVRFNVIDIPIT